MFGPPRLMVIAAKALQQKLVDELAAVESGTASSPLPDDAAAASDPAADARAARDGRPTIDVVVAHPDGDTGLPDSSSAADAHVAAAGAAAKVAALEAQQQQQDSDDVDDTSQIPSPVGELLSPFAARSHKKWTASSLSDRSGSTASVDMIGFDALTAAAAPAPAVPAAAGPAVSLISDTTTDAASVAAGPDAALSFTSAQIAAAAAVGGAAGALDTPQHEFSFAPIAQGHQGPAALHEHQHQQQFSSNASDAGVSTSTVPGSASAVAGTPAGSVVSSSVMWPESSTTGASKAGGSTRWLAAAAPTLQFFSNSSSNQLAAGTQSADGSATAADAYSNGAVAYPAATGAGSLSSPGAAVPSSAVDSGKPDNRSRAAAAGGGRHRRAQSTAAVLDADKRGSVVVQRQGSGKTHSRRATADWLRPMDSLRRAASRR